LQNESAKTVARVRTIGLARLHPAHAHLDGELQRLIDHDGLRGVTSNPAIFEKAITGSSDYAAALKLLKQHQLEPGDLFEEARGA